MIEALQGSQARQRRAPGWPYAGTRILGRESEGLVRQGRAVTRLARSLSSAVAGAREASTTRAVSRTGAELLAKVLPQPGAALWLSAQATRQQVLSRLLAPLFALDAPLRQQTRRLYLITVISWLEAQRGGCWQDRWLVGVPRPRVTGGSWSPGMRVVLRTDLTCYWQRLERLLEDADQGVVGGQQTDHPVGPGHDRGTDRRQREPAALVGLARAGCGPSTTARSSCWSAGSTNTTPSWPRAAGPDRPAHRPDRPPLHPDRGS